MAADFYIRGDTTLDGKGFQQGLGRIGNIAVKGFAVVSGAAVGALGAIAAAGVKYNSSMEQYQTNLTTMLEGNTQAARELTSEIEKLAASTPLAMGDLMSAAQTLMAFGAADASNMTDTLQMLGDVALGDADKLQSLATAFGQMSSTGKLQGQDLLQFINAGFNPLVELEKMGYGTVASLKEQMSKGAISVEMVTAAFQHATSEGGTFYKAMEAQSKTLEGRLSTLEDNANALAGALTEELSAGLGDAVDVAIGIVDQLTAALESGGIEGFAQAGLNIVRSFVQKLWAQVPSLLQTGSDIIQQLTEGVVAGIPQMLGKALPMMKRFSATLREKAALLVDTGLAMITQLVQGISGSLPNLMRSIVPIVENFIGILTDNFPQIFNTGMELLGQIVSGLAAGIPQLLAWGLPMLAKLSGMIRENAGVLVDSGLSMIIQLVQGLINGLPSLIAYVPTIVENIAGIINDNFPKILATGVKLIWMLIQGIIDNIPNLIANAANIVSAIVSVISAMNWLNLGKNLLTAIKDGIVAMKSVTVAKAKEIFTNFLNTIKNIKWVDLGKNIVQGILNGIKSMAGAVFEAAKNLANAFVGKTEEEFEIGSPSRRMAREIGRWLPPGVAVGVEASTDDALTAIDDMANQMVSRAQLAIAEDNFTNAKTLRESGSGSAEALREAKEGPEQPDDTKGGHTTNFYQTINSHDSLSPSEMTREAEDFLERSKWQIP